MLPLEIESYLRPSGRPREIVVGIVVGVLALFFLYLATFVLVVAAMRGFFEPPYLDRGKLEFLLVPEILLALGLPGGWVAFRLLAARRRRDGGLFSPAVLRMGGALMIAVAVWSLAEAPLSPLSPKAWADAVTLVIAGIACWVLAQRRTPRDVAEPATPAG